jgi:hypothetical protein
MALRVLNAYAVFGVSLLHGEKPQRPQLTPEQRGEKRKRWKRNKLARLAFEAATAQQAS